MATGVVENVFHVELFVDLSPRPFTVVHRDFAWKSVFRAGWLVLPEWCLEELMHHIYGVAGVVFRGRQITRRLFTLGIVTIGVEA